MSSSQAADEELPLADVRIRLPAMFRFRLTAFQRLKSSLWFSIARICTEECSLLSASQSDNTAPTPQFIGALTDMVWLQIENVAVDLETFSRHAGRSTITTDDVLLICRRNEALQGIMKDFIEMEEAENERPKNGGAKGKAKAKK